MPRASNSGEFCSRCSAWRGALGLEPTIGLYVEHLVQVFRLLRRVMRPEATAWLNLGDCYATGGGKVGKCPGGGKQGENWQGPVTQPNRLPIPGLKPKDLCMIPFRVALALQGDAWYLRSVIPWVKHCAMPESVTDRPTNAIEYMFQLTKSENYYYDREAERIAAGGNKGGGRQRAAIMGDQRCVRMAAPKDSDGRTGRHAEYQPSSRARRNTDWFFSSLEAYSKGFQGMLLDDEADPLALVVNPQPFSLEMCDTCERCYDRREYRQLAENAENKRVCYCGESSWVSHFATFPERIVSPCIALSTSEYGCCSVCGAPYERVVEKQRVGDWHPDPAHKHDRGAAHKTENWAKRDPRSDQFSSNRIGAARENLREATGKHDDYFPVPQTSGWRPTCSHPLLSGEPVPCTVLDPFAGSGRTGLAAAKLGRNAVLIERNPQYVKMIEWQMEREGANAKRQNSVTG